MFALGCIIYEILTTVTLFPVSMATERLTRIAEFTAYAYE